MVLILWALGTLGRCKEEPGRHREGQAVRLHLLPKYAKATNLSGWLGMRSQCQGAGGHLLSPQKVALCPRSERSLCQACKMHGTIGPVIGTPLPIFPDRKQGWKV